MADLLKPTTIRLTPANRDGAQRYAAERGISLNSAYNLLIRAALAAEEQTESARRQP